MLRPPSRNASRGMHNWLVMAETAIGVVLLVGSGLLIRSFVRVLQVDPGFDLRHVLTARLTVPSARYTQPQRLVGTSVSRFR